MNNNEKLKKIVSLILAICGSIFYAINVNTFIYSADIVPGGLSVFSLLIQNLIIKFFNISISFTLLNVIFNLPPAILAFKWVGKKFTIISFILMFISAFLVDLIPKYHLTNDPLLASVFGGIITGFSLGLMLNQGVSGGGTDFISMSLSAKYHISAFNYMLIFNIVIICIHGYNFGVNTALYSIIYQFCSTQVVNFMYKRFQKRTILIVTEHPDDIVKALISMTKHTATKISGVGCFSGKEKTVIYTILTQPQVKKISLSLKAIDKNIFINIIETEKIEGNYYYAPVGNL
ncbi:MAG: YitT family protein [Eubacteriales bacterium]|nr:YitT family protein [Eubacteriales bacterium]